MEKGTSMGVSIGEESQPSGSSNNFSVEAAFFF